MEEAGDNRPYQERISSIVRSAERSEAKTLRPETQYCRKQDQLLPAFLMLLPLVALKEIVAALAAGEIGFLYEIGIITDEAVPCIPDIAAISAVMLLLPKEPYVRFANAIAVLIMVHQIGDYAALTIAAMEVSK